MHIWIPLALLVATMLAGCASEVTYTTPEQDEQGRYLIHLVAGNRFSPANAQVPTGATVLWVAETPGHDVVAYDGAFESELMSAGESYESTFNTPGEHDYRCRPHESVGMKGKLLVGDA